MRRELRLILHTDLLLGLSGHRGRRNGDAPSGPEALGQHQRDVAGLLQRRVGADKFLRAHQAGDGLHVPQYRQGHHRGTGFAVNGLRGSPPQRPHARPEFQRLAAQHVDGRGQRQHAQRSDGVFRHPCAFTAHHVSIYLQCGGTQSAPRVLLRGGCAGHDPPQHQAGRAKTLGLRAQRLHLELGLQDGSLAGQQRQRPRAQGEAERRAHVGRDCQRQHGQSHALGLTRHAGRQYRGFHRVAAGIEHSVQHVVCAHDERATVQQRAVHTPLDGAPVDGRLYSVVTAHWGKHLTRHAALAQLDLAVSEHQRVLDI